MATDAERWRRLTELLEPIHRQAAGTARRLAKTSTEGDDLLQETVLRAHAGLDSLRDESRFRAWFFAILLSVHRSRSRRSFWRRFLPIDEAFVEGSGPAVESEREEERWRSLRVRRALASLPPEQREAIVLHDLDGFSVEEVAAMQRASESCVKSRLSRGRARLRRWYLRREGMADRSIRHGARSDATLPLLARPTGAGASGEEV